MLTRVVRAVALLLLGVYCGGLVFWVLAPRVQDLPGPAFVRYWQALNLDYGARMPVLVMASLVLLVATSALSVRRGRAVLVLSVAATVLLVGSIVVTLTQMEPLNRLADAWNPDSLPADWTDTKDLWAQWQFVRTALVVAALGCLLASQTLPDAPRRAGRRLARTAPG